MKKTLVALAALAATSAFAQSSVTITGLIDMGYQSLNSPANSAGLQTGDLKRIAHNGTGTTAIILGVTEEINSDLSASIRYEMNPDFINGAGLTGGAGVQSGTAVVGSAFGAASDGKIAYGTGANGYNFIGVNSKSMGGIKFGRLNTGTLAAWGTGQVFGTALGGGFGSAGVFTRYGSSSANYIQTAPTRFNNSVEYQSPAIMGVTLRALMAPKVDVNGIGGESACLVAATCALANVAAPGANRAGVSDISLGYSQGPLNAMYSTQKISTGAGDTNALVNPALQSTASTNVTTNVLAANYTLGATRLYAGSFTVKAGTTIDDKGTMFGVKHTMGQIDLMANLTTLKSNLTGVSLNEADRKVVGLGADYNLSKRTAVYFRNEARNLDTGSTVTTPGSATATVGAKTTTTAVGFRHTF